MAPLAMRRVSFEYPDDFDADWVRGLPELACAANSVSLHMPYAEPFFVRTVHRSLELLPETMRDEAEAFAAQEARHHGQHRRFNKVVRRQYPGVSRIERWMARSYRWLDRRSLRFQLAYAAAAETMAYSLARWTDKHLGDLFLGADPLATTLFLWHLAEEVEHKSVAFDIWASIDGSRWRYLRAGALAVFLCAVFTIGCCTVMLRGQRRLMNPVAWFRLTKLAISLAFEVLPTMAVSAMPGHHPSKLVDPSFLQTFLRRFDPETGTMPLWEPAAA